jgi:hypothetical protein
MNHVPDVVPSLVDVLNWADEPRCQEKSAYVLMILLHRSYDDCAAISASRRSCQWEAPVGHAGGRAPTSQLDVAAVATNSSQYDLNMGKQSTVTYLVTTLTTKRKEDVTDVDHQS